MFGDCAWDKAAMHVWATTIGINARVAFMGAAYLSRQARGNVSSMFWFLDFSCGPLIGRVHPIDLRRAHIEH
ncbi:MAG: hypothetical protein DMG97_28710 [Acidobacteria bacterium]|nr:MAG: hypothetical protein DMG97_28710 [Acidobacteriota bacterium]